MGYVAWSVVAFEQPTAAKWNLLGSNDSSFNDGTGLPIGTCVQIADSLTSAVATGTTVIPVDDTIPQSSEGDQYMTVTITPRNANNKLVVEVTFYGAINVAGDLVVALFQDSGVNALVVGSSHETSSSNEKRQIKLYYSIIAGSTAATTFKVRAGPNTAGTTTINGSNAGRLFGTSIKSSIVVREFTQ